MNLKEKVVQIAQHLEGWEAHQPSLDNDQWIQLRKAGDGEQPSIGCRVDGSDAEIHDHTRLQFAGGWPYSMPGQSFYPYESHKIGCAAKRTPASIAVSIRHRLLPAYLPKWKEMFEQKRKYIKSVGQRAAIIAEIANILGKEISRNGARVYVESGSFRACINGTFDIKLSGISAEVARKIATILASG